MLYYRYQPSKPDRVEPETISRVRDVLRNLSNKSKASISLEEEAVDQHKSRTSISLKDAIYQLQNSLKAALVKGYSYKELANLLQHEGIPISSSSLETYLASTKRQASENKISPKSEDQNSDNLSEQVEVVIPVKTGSVSHTVRSDFWTAYQESLNEREEVYRRLAES